MIYCAGALLVYHAFGHRTIGCTTGERDVLVKTVLVVEDDDAILLLLEEVLGEEGYTVRKATNGLEGLEQVLQHHPDLVISDLMMPVLDGIDMAAAIRADARYRDLPLVAISGARRPDDRLRALFTDFLAKPFSVTDLVERVEQALGGAH